MSTLGAVRHTVRGTAVRVRRAALWTPTRFRGTVAVAVAVLVLVPVGSLLARAPGSVAVRPPVAAVEAPGGLDNGLGGAVDVGDAGHDHGDAPGDAGTGPVGADPSAGTPSPTTSTEPPVDPTPLPVEQVLTAGAGTDDGPAREPGAATGEPTLAPDQLEARWAGQARFTAVSFAQAWLAGATAPSSQQWLATLEPWLDPAAEPLVAMTNLAAIPQTTATTAQLLTLTEAEATAVVGWASGGRLDVALAWDGESWRVTSYEPVEAGSAGTPASSSPSAPSGTPTPVPSGTPSAP